MKRRDNGHWDAPDDVLEQDEDIVTSPRREVQEEIGLDVAPTALTGVYKNMTRGIVAMVFRCKAAPGSLREFRRDHRLPLGHSRRGDRTGRRSLRHPSPRCPDHALGRVHRRHG
nr:NUDIX domain-containing protein [Actinomadura roseirufa]